MAGKESGFFSSEKKSRSKQIEKLLIVGGFGGALLGMAVGLPVWFNRTAAWVGVGGAAAYGVERYLDSRKK